ncbi:MAG TPA: hypothetical protein PK683_06170, partial [Leptospiraceae bacterium]|nr:hypothetical protein [Leptospiraceae bacterium]
MPEKSLRELHKEAKAFLKGIAEDTKPSAEDWTLTACKQSISDDIAVQLYWFSKTIAFFPADRHNSIESKQNKCAETFENEYKSQHLPIFNTL